ncbi:MAG: class I SAM-dependent methyltransferase [Methanosarcinales archaeon]|nr:class I SAM-dependent methyltransferase [Methanosarcinales archaeon]
MPHRWSNSAELRRYQIESGLDVTFNEVFKPIFTNRVFALEPNKILEVGAGTGHLSKELVKNGCHITAIEPSRGMFHVAEDVLKGENVNLINCSSYDLPETSMFDVALSHMVAHVVDDIKKFFASIARHLSCGAHFIFSIPHPCFYNDYKMLFGPEYNYMTPVTKEISFSITRDLKNVISGVPYHHRPLSEYINGLVDSGFAIDGFDETYPSTEIQNMYGSPWEAPRYCVFICKKL